MNKFALTIAAIATLGLAACDTNKGADNAVVTEGEVNAAATSNMEATMNETEVDVNVAEGESALNAANDELDNASKAVENASEAVEDAAEEATVNGM